MLIFKQSKKSFKHVITIRWQVWNIFFALFSWNSSFWQLHKTPQLFIYIKSAALTVIHIRSRVHEKETEVSSNDGWANARMPCAICLRQWWMRWRLRRRKTKRRKRKCRIRFYIPRYSWSCNRPKQLNSSFAAALDIFSTHQIKIEIRCGSSLRGWDVLQRCHNCSPDTVPVFMSLWVSRLWNWWGFGPLALPRVYLPPLWSCGCTLRSDEAPRYNACCALKWMMLAKTEEMLTQS